MSIGAWLFQLFIRITGYPVYRFWVNPRFRYEDRKAQGRLIKGKAIIVSNHTTVWDFGFWLYALPFRAHRCIMADVLKHINFFLTLFLKMNQGIFVSRKAQDLGFIKQCQHILDKGGVVQVFPESRIAVHRKDLCNYRRPPRKPLIRSSRNGRTMRISKCLVLQETRR